MNEKYYFTLAEASRLVEVNARKLATQLDGRGLAARRLNRNFNEVLYSLEDLVGCQDDVPSPALRALLLHDEMKKMFKLSNGKYAAGEYAFTITEASRLTSKSGNWIHLLIQNGKINKFEGRRIKDHHKKKSLISVEGLRVLGLDFKPDDVFKLFTLK